MKIDLKAIKHFPSMSEETDCYQASLYVDGKKIGTVSNRGTGGPDEFHGDRSAYERADQWCKDNLPPYTLDLAGSQHTGPTDLEMHCGDLLGQHIAAKELKRILKREALFTVPDKSGLFSMKYKEGQAPDDILYREIAKQNPGATILNTLPVIEALHIFRAEG